MDYGKILVVTFTAAVVLLGRAQAQQAATPSDDPVARGGYLALLGDCASCHTAPGGAAYAGGRGLDAGFGTIYSANITPDRQTGIGGWSADQFYTATHKGIAADGAHLYPAFPYPYFTRLTRADSDAIYAFLQSLPAVSATAPPNKLPFPLDIRGLMAIWNALYLDEGEYRYDDNKSAEWNRGAYIVTGPGHCGACHTPKNFLMADENDHALSGGVIENWFAADLLGDQRAGLAGWSQADIEEYLSSGRNARAMASGLMQDVIQHSTSQMTSSDRAAIAAYLKELPSGAGEETPPGPDPAVLRSGATLFSDNCSRCHGAQGMGRPGLFPPLAGNAAVQSRDATTLIHLVLQGARPLATPGAAAPPAMPAFDSRLDDRQIAEVLTYIRNSWGNQGDRVAGREVEKLRAALAMGGGK